jgi:molybdate transport system ATP-binding protein
MAAAADGAPMSGPLHVQFEKRFRGGPTIVAEWEQPADAYSVTVLFGPSGCGKTTALRCVAGLERPNAGVIHFGPDVWFDAGRGLHLPPQRRGVGFLFQDYALFSHRTVAGNVGYAIGRSGRERVAELLTAFELEGLGGRYPSQISGGQQQRVALARALAGRPRVLLLDEPLSALDQATRDELRPALRRLLAGLGIPVVLVTHDRAEAIALGDQIVVMDRGRVLQRGSVEEVFSRPRDPAVAWIVGTETVQPGTVIAIVDGLATVRVGSATLTAVPPAVTDSPASSRDVFVCIRGEDVALHRNGGEGSPRNRLPAVVNSLTPEGPLVRVGLDCGFPLIALVTRPASAELDLKIGDRLTAVVKAPAVHLAPRRASP